MIAQYVRVAHRSILRIEYDSGAESITRVAPCAGPRVGQYTTVPQNNEISHSVEAYGNCTGRKGCNSYLDAAVKPPVVNCSQMPLAAKDQQRLLLSGRLPMHMPCNTHAV